MTPIPPVPVTPAHRGSAVRARSRLARRGARVREVIAQTCALVAVRECPCGAEDTWLCPSCRALLAQSPRRVESGCDALQLLSAARVRDQPVPRGVLPAGVDHAPLLPVLALGEYGGDLQALVLAWKNGGLLHLTAPIAAGLAPAVTQLAAAAGEERPALVPVPSRPAARLRRGEDHTGELARQLQRHGAGRALLLPSRPSSTQHGQGSRGRRSRRILLTPGARRRLEREQPRVVLLDDVVTTGSTLRAMYDAVTEAGAEVIGAVVVAASRLPTRQHGPVAAVSAPTG